MDSPWLLVMTVVAELHLESILLRFVSKRLAAAPYVMPFKPLSRVAYKALAVIFLNDAIHYSPHLDNISAIWSGVSVWIPFSLQSKIIRSMSLDICAVSYVEEP